ncbi:hypothetical protein KM043_008346 [Ampulex compressa]|nr:hypothetical protein KM043_008346 [Ampulex compressa]
MALGFEAGNGKKTSTNLEGGAIWLSDTLFRASSPLRIEDKLSDQRYCLLHTLDLRSSLDGPEKSCWLEIQTPRCRRLVTRFDDNGRVSAERRTCRTIEQRAAKHQRVLGGRNRVVEKTRDASRRKKPVNNEARGKSASDEKAGETREKRRRPNRRREISSESRLVKKTVRRLNNAGLRCQECETFLP